MILEHLVVNLSLAVLVVTLLSWEAGKWHAAILVATAYAPDIDKILPFLFDQSILAAVFPELTSGYFHHLAMLLFVSLLIGSLFQILFRRVLLASLLAGIGFGTHLLLDTLVFNRGYAIFWPLSSERTHFALLAPYILDVWGVANSRILLVTLLLLGAVMLLQIRSSGGTKRS